MLKIELYYSADYMIVFCIEYQQFSVLTFEGPSIGYETLSNIGIFYNENNGQWKTSF